MEELKKNITEAFNREEKAKMNTPKLSLIMPVYNQEKLVVRALDSIPLAKDTQVIIIDDGSTDDSWKKVIEWYDKNFTKIHGNSVICHTENRGVARAMNLGFNIAKGEYIISLSSDDYYTTDFEPFRKYLDGKNDLVYFNLEVNDGSIWHINAENKNIFVGAVKFIRREFLGDTRVPDLKWSEDYPFSQALYAKKPREVFTDVVLKHYNYPREGSLIWQAQRKEKRKCQRLTI